MTMFQRKAKVFKNIEVAQNYYKMIFECSAIARAAKPGQFIEVRVTEGSEPLLRRPLGVHSVKGNFVEVLFEALGSGTRALSKRKAGESVDLLGPLGNGFSVTQDGIPVLVAGGMGVAPLLFLAQQLVRSSRSADRRKIIVLIGAKTKSRILCEGQFKKLGCKVTIATDDGSRGFRGFVSGLLKKELQSADHGLWTIYACGPHPMLWEVSNVADSCGVACQVSLEAHMACGIGACLGCVVKVRPAQKRPGEFEYQRVCKEGPVFQANQIVWGKE